MQGTPKQIFEHKGKLKEMKLELPFALSFSEKLKNEGIFKDSYCTLDEVVNELCQLRSTN